MIPWPIALLTVFFGALATISVARAVKILTGLTAGSLIWQLIWTVVCAGAMAGLPFFKPWARRLAVSGLIGMTVATLSVAGLLVMRGRPLAALLATCGSVVYMIALRYLGRPQVKAWFVK